MVALMIIWFMLGMCTAVVVGLHMKLRYDSAKEDAEFEARYMANVRG